MIAIYNYRKPTVPAIAGIAPGYGMDLANMCDVTVTSKNEQFRSTQVKYTINGSFHGMVRFLAEEVYRVGLVNELAFIGQIRATAMKLAKNIDEARSEMTTGLKEVARRSNNMDHMGATAYELCVTSDLVQRNQFTRMIKEGSGKKYKGKENSSLGEALSSISCMPPATGDRVFRD
ncbi:ClpP/crotonase-like domain-containing protein [Ilyonectria sp. MPI-CAGE-AT-0026]|nr:ClpP/crotonase-like domain-containing protein [Ilyonectria sp. MPI-CAGE-AT-0026]